MNSCHRMLPSSTQLPNRSFHVMERMRMTLSVKCPKNKNSCAKCAKLLVFNVKIRDTLFAITVVVAQAPHWDEVDDLKQKYSTTCYCNVNKNYSMKDLSLWLISLLRWKKKQNGKNTILHKKEVDKMRAGKSSWVIHKGWLN